MVNLVKSSKSKESLLDKSVLRAQSIWERLEVNADCSYRGINGSKVYNDDYHLIHSWKKLIANNRDEVFIRRLKWDGYSVEDIALVMTSDCIRCNKEAIAWKNVLQRIIGSDVEEMSAIYQSIDNLEKDRVLKHSKPIPFEDVFIPYIQYSRHLLEKKCGNNYHILTKKAHINLERILLNRLGNLFFDVLYRAYTHYRLVGISMDEALSLEDYSISAIRNIENLVRPAKINDDFDRVDNSNHNELGSNNSEFDQFVKYIQYGGLFKILNKYPIAARNSVVICRLWIEAMSEFINRLHKDWDAICNSFNNGNSFASITHIEGNHGDMHEGGRSVLILSLENSKKIVYKPRSIELEEYFYNLLEWINQESELPSLRVIKVINRKKYGWIEYIEDEPCKNLEEIRRFYVRCGMLLGIVYVLNGSDFHKENMIAAGENPVLIDLETILGHGFKIKEKKKEGENILNWADAKISDSVINTIMLPKYKYINNTNPINIGAIGGNYDTGLQIPKNKVININTDDMRLALGKGDRLSSSNLPSLAGAYVRPFDWVDEIVEGFKSIYLFILSKRAFLINNDSVMFQFKKCKGRYLFRNTSLYAKILYYSCKAKYLQDGLDRSVLIDSLSRALVHLEAKPVTWPIIRYEREALEKLDIPNFYTRSDSRHLYLPNGDIIKNCFHTTALEEVRNRLKSLNDKDLAFQIKVIRGSLITHQANDPNMKIQCIKKSKPYENISNNSDLVPLSRENAIEEALHIGESLHKRAYVLPKKGAIWFGVNYNPYLDHYTYGAINGDLYNGLSGRGIFLSALARVTGSDRFYDLAIDTITSLRSYVHEFIRALSLSRGLENVANQCSSVIFGLCQVSILLRDSSLLSDALNIAYLLDRSILQRVSYNGLLNGMAGITLSLLRLYQLTDNSDVLSRTLQSAHILLSNERTKKSENTNIETLYKPCDTDWGFARGRAGVIYALLNLYETTNDSAFLNAARKELALERKHLNVFDNTMNKEYVNLSWVSGLCGSGIMRLKALHLLDDDLIIDEINMISTLLKQYNYHEPDTLHAGSFGYLDFLLSVALEFNQKSLILDIKKTATKLVFNARKRGYYISEWDKYSPLGLFWGMAGIGYQLLRISEPTLFPSVLAFDIPMNTGMQNKHKKEVNYVS
ncbi:type 2 lanthipeptide synthetase LanM [Rhodocaloribacter sp.]